MSIANELSCDVVAAMLARREDQTESNSEDLTEIVLEFHSTLRHLTDEERRRRRAQILLTHKSVPSDNSKTASGNH